MGCDIHIRVQVRRGDAQAKRVACVAARLNGTSDDGEWETLLPPVCKWSYEGGPYYRSWYHERNYTVFGVLAGVRNRDVACIAEPRGLPAGVMAHDDDSGYGETYVDPEGDSRVQYCRNELGDHSFTWYLASELLDAPQWNQIAQDEDEPRSTYNVRDACAEFIDWMGAELAPLAERHGAGNVRVVMGFDN